MSTFGQKREGARILKSALNFESVTPDKSLYVNSVDYASKVESVAIEYLYLEYACFSEEEARELAHDYVKATW